MRISPTKGCLQICLSTDQFGLLIHIRKICLGLHVLERKFESRTCQASYLVKMSVIHASGDTMASDN